MAAAVNQKSGYVSADRRGDRCSPAQSSSATSALVVGFVSTKMMTLAQALGVLLGSSFGSSLTAQLIAYQITDLALALLFTGAILYLFAKRSQRRNLG
jgi:phosphate:Na+ symporter